MSDTQFGFRDDIGTMKALFGIQVLFQRCKDVNCGVYACLIDYQMAFQHGMMVEILKNVGLDNKNIINLFSNQSDFARVEGEKTEETEVLLRKGGLYTLTVIILPYTTNKYAMRPVKKQNVVY